MKFSGLAKLKAHWDTVHSSYWFTPTLMALCTAVLWILVHWIDLQLGRRTVRTLGWIYTGGPEGARELLGVVAGSMVTVTGVTFSITIVALTLASQQFGPFLLRNFMRDTGNQVVLGTFISTFLFCLLTLKVIRGSDGVTHVPHLSITVALLLAIGSLGVLIYFIHHVAMSIQVSNIIEVVSRDLQRTISALFPEGIGMEMAAVPATPSAPPELPDSFDAASATVAASGYGYLVTIDEDMLLQVATEHDLVVRLLKKPGAFVGEGDGIASIDPPGSLTAAVAEGINRSLVLDRQRTATQDVEFVFHQMVEIAVRALSPGVNNPFTALICIDYLGQGLRHLAGRQIPSPCRLDRQGALRIVALPTTFAELADIAFNQIRHYGRSDSEVLRRLLDTLAALAPHLHRDCDQQALLRHATRIREAAKAGLGEEAARSELGEKYASVLAALQAAPCRTSRSLEHQDKQGC